MKTAFLAATALVSSSLISTSALADTIPQPVAAGPDATTEAAMQAQCDALAAIHDVDGAGVGDRWSAEVVPGTATLTGAPTEVGGTRVVDQGSIQHAGTYVPATTEIRGDPFRHGGSVNLFGDMWSTAGYWTDSTYNYDANFDSTFSYAFSCNIYQEVYHASYVIPGHPVEGYYTNPGTEPSGGEGSCQGVPNTNPHWGTSFGACEWHETGPATQDETVPESWDDAAFVINEAGVAISQAQTDSLTAFEDHGGPVQVTGEFHVGQGVICISPGKKGGEWRAQNGYDGGSFSGAGSPPAAGCNTNYFKVAPWGSGTETSNGTYTSVPDYNL